MTARRHHFISQFYLNAFTNADTGRLFVMDVVRHKTFFARPRDVALELDFNRIDSASQPTDALEALVSKMESDVAHIIKRMRTTETFEHHPDIFAFMALLFVRNPAVRKRSDDLINQIANFIGASYASDAARFRQRVKEMKARGDIGTNTDIETMREALLEKSFKVRMTRHAHLDLEFKTVGNIFPYFAGRSWTLCIAGHKSTGFITSDRPVSVSWEDPERSDSPGLGLMGTQILFPISARLLLWGRIRTDESRREVDEAFVARANRHILGSINRQLYAGDDTFPLPKKRATS